MEDKNYIILKKETSEFRKINVKLSFVCTVILAPVCITLVLDTFIRCLKGSFVIYSVRFGLILVGLIEE